MLLFVRVRHTHSQLSALDLSVFIISAIAVSNVSIRCCQTINFVIDICHCVQEMEYLPHLVKFMSFHPPYFIHELISNIRELISISHELISISHELISISHELISLSQELILSTI